MTFAFPVQFFHGRDMHGQSKHGKCTLQLTALKKCNKKYAITAFKVQETLLEIQKFKKFPGVACPTTPQIFMFYL